MPKNKGKGGKNRRRGKNEDDENKELFFKTDDQEYAQVVRLLGNCNLDIICLDEKGTKRSAHIRGKLRKKVWISVGDIILVGLRDFQDDVTDVLARYTADDARQLKAAGEIPAHVKINESDVTGAPEEDNVGFEFGVDEEDEKEREREREREAESASDDDDDDDEEEDEASKEQRRLKEKKAKKDKKEKRKENRDKKREMGGGAGEDDGMFRKVEIDIDDI